MTPSRSSQHVARRSVDLEFDLGAGWSRMPLQQSLANGRKGSLCGSSNKRSSALFALIQSFKGKQGGRLRTCFTCSASSEYNTIH